MVTLEYNAKKVIVTSDKSKEVQTIKQLLRVKEDRQTIIYKRKYNPKYDGFIRFYNSEQKGISFSVGFLPLVVDALKELNINYDKSNFPSYGVKVNEEELTPTLRDYQKEAVLSFFNRDFPFVLGGVIKVPTRGGKTFTAAEKIRIFILNNPNKNCLFIVDGTDLLNQAKKEIEDFLGTEVGVIGGNKNNPKQITVATSQKIKASLFPSKRSKEKIRREKRKAINEFLETISFLIIDEIHDNTSSKTFKIVKSCNNLEHFSSLSATPFKDNQIQNYKLLELSGDIIYEVKKKVLEEKNVLSKQKVLLILNNSEYGNFFGEAFEKMVYDKKRNDLLIEICETVNKSKIKTLFIFSSKEHGRNFSDLTNIRYINGDDKIEEREKVKDKFLENNEGDFVLLASNIYKKGKTLTKARIFVNPSLGKESSDLIQKYGRVIGNDGDKPYCIIIDVLDMCNVFSEHSLSRLETYEREIGKENIFITEMNSFNELLCNLIKTNLK